jgi:hypothetical protein
MGNRESKPVAQGPSETIRGIGSCPDPEHLLRETTIREYALRVPESISKTKLLVADERNARDGGSFAERQGPLPLFSFFLSTSLSFLPSPALSSSEAGSPWHPWSDVVPSRNTPARAGREQKIFADSARLD